MPARRHPIILHLLLLGLLVLQRRRCGSQPNNAARKVSLAGREGPALDSDSQTDLVRDSAKAPWRKSRGVLAARSSCSWKGGSSATGAHATLGGSCAHAPS